MGADSGSDKMFRAEFSSLVNSFKWTTCKLHDGIIQTCKCLCYKEEQNLTPCWIFSFTSTFASHFSCSLEGHCPYIKACLGEPSPSAWSLSQNPFVQDPEHLWMATGRKKLTHLLPRLAIPGDICEINGLFTLLPHLSLLYSIKEPGIQTPNGGYFETLPPSQSACFPNKSIFFASTPCSWLIGLLCGEQSKLGLSNT